MIVKSYPLNVEDTDGHYILFTIFERAEQVYKYGFKGDTNVEQAQFVNSEVKNQSVSRLLKEKQKRLKARAPKENIYAKRGRTTIFGARNNARKDSDTPVGAISIYTPKSISVNHKSNYSDEAITGLGNALQVVIDNDSGIEGTKKALKGLGRTVAGSLAQLGGTGGALQSGTGSAVNQSQAEVLFTGLDYRTFSFDFSFMPSNAKEAQTVDDIINMFTYYMLPDRKQNNAMTYELPAEFNLKYMYRGRQNKYIHPALTLVLENMDIKYGGEKFATFRGNDHGAQPIKTDVTLTFREVEIADRATLYKGLEGVTNTEIEERRQQRYKDMGAMGGAQFGNRDMDGS
jgi:hypothetical protein